MSEEKNPTTASATEHDPVIAGTPEAAGASPAPQRHGRRTAVVAAVVAAILVVAGVGMWVWHEQPSFCNAVCHTPMDSYVEAYYADDATLLATSHRVADVSCLDCHVPTLGEQLAEGAAWVAGGYELPLEQRQFDDEFCMNGSCHAIGQGSLAQITAQREYNPHSNYHEELACGTCHKSHTASVMQCAQCHSDADVPAGWVVR